MSRSLKDFNIPVANFSSNERANPAIIEHEKSNPSRSSLRKSRADPSSANPNFTSDFPSTPAFWSTPDEDGVYESKLEALSLGNKVEPQEHVGAVAASDGGPTSEIQNIMGQFDKGNARPEVEDDRSSRFTGQAPLLGASIPHPQRESSLEPLREASESSKISPSSRPRSSSTADVPQIYKGRAADTFIDSNPLHPHDPAKIIRSGNNPVLTPPSSDTVSRKALPPEPDSEPDLAFDFHRFLEQLRHRTADPVAKFLRSFLIEFGKKQWMAHEQGKIISDFLAFIANKMALCEIWRGLSEAEFDNAKEGMEKLVMNRLYSQTFSPAIPLSVSIPAAKSKRRMLDRSLLQGRTGQHQEDVERDEILCQKVLIYSWIREEHLDILPVGDSGQRFLALAQQGIILRTPS